MNRLSLVVSDVAVLAQDHRQLLAAAKLALARLEADQSSLNYCEECNAEAPRVEDVYVGDVTHTPDCAYWTLKQAVAAVEDRL